MVLENVVTFPFPHDLAFRTISNLLKYCSFGSPSEERASLKPFYAFMDILVCFFS